MAILTRNNRFIVDYYPNGRNGKRVRMMLPEFITSVEAAREIERDLKRTARTKEVVHVPSSSTVDDLFDDYLEWYGLHRSPTTKRDLSYTYDKSISTILGKAAVEAINDAHISLYQRLRLGQGVQNRTINKELNYFSGFLKWCSAKKKLKTSLGKIDHLPYKRPAPIVLSIGEVIRIVEAAEPFYRAFFLCLYTLGLRLTEARMLKWSNIDFDERRLQVTQKGGSTKVLPVSEWLSSALEAIKTDPPDSDYVFYNKITEKPLYGVRKALARAVLKAKVNKRVYPHLFRHSIATHLMGKNVNMRIIQGYLGHAQIGTTEFYTHIDGENLRDAGDVIQIEYDKSVSSKSSEQ